MTKIAYNSCSGGFSLSDEAIELYCQLKGIPLYKKRGFVMNKWYTSADFSDDSFFSPYDFNRTDPFLIEVIERLGAKASGPCANLKITELPRGTRYRIDDYNGNEAVLTIHDYEWKVA